MFLRSALKRWRQWRRPPLETALSYEVVCPCGRPLRGQRQRASQLVACPGCGRQHFILPDSPWRERGASDLSPVAAPPASVNPRRFVLVIVVGGAAAMGLIFLAIKPYLRRPTDTTAEARSDARALMETGRRELREGNARLALKRFQAAIEAHRRDPQSLHREEWHRLQQMRRQSDLLAHLLDNPLEEILQQALQVRDEAEWDAKFADYRGRGVIFEDVLRRDASGRPALGFYALRVGDVEARIALEDLSLLRQLPLDPPPQRWLFGARLASCRREGGGVWTFHFEPESAVLLTDEDAASACWPGLLEDELRAVLRRQDEWLRR